MCSEITILRVNLYLELSKNNFSVNLVNTYTSSLEFCANMGFLRVSNSGLGYRIHNS